MDRHSLEFGTAWFRKRTGVAFAVESDASFASCTWRSDAKGDPGRESPVVATTSVIFDSDLGAMDKQ